MAQILPQVPGLRLWLVWLATAVVLLYVKPWGGFGWDEWLVCALPLLLLHPALRFMDVLSAGLAASTLAWIAVGDPSGGWPELACLWAVLAVGAAIGYIATQAGEDGESQAPIAYKVKVEDVFAKALDRELCRVRRHDGSFALLSVDQHSSNGGTSLQSVHELLNTELHAYADIVTIGDRVLALVPEVKDEQHQPLLQRLMSKAANSPGGEIRLGMARFPQDAVCAQELIEAADRKRSMNGVSLIRDTKKGEAPGEVPS